MLPVALVIACSYSWAVPLVNVLWMHVLWYGFVLFAAIWLIRRRNVGASAYIPSLELRALMLTLLFIFSVSYFTNRYRYVPDFTQINRALVYCVPVMMFYTYV